MRPPLISVLCVNARWLFSLVMTDFGLSKFIDGKFSMMAVDIYQQTVGQQNFEMGAAPI
jgi:ABC-type Fe3+ transport system permease subunit